MPAFNKSDRSAAIALIVILSLAAVLRFLYLAQIQANPLPDDVIRFETFDQYRFMGPVKEFLKGHWLGTQVPAKYSIAYSYLIAFLYSFFPQSINTLFTFQILLGLLAVYIFYRAASLLFYNKNVGLIAAFIAAFYSPFLFQECDMERGAIIAYANLLGFYFLLKAVRKYKLRYFFFAGLMMGASTVMRGNALSPFIVVYLLFAVKKLYPFKISSIAVFLAGMLLITSPLSLRNKIVGNTFFIEPQAIENFWVGNTYDSPGVDFQPHSSSRIALTKESQNSGINMLKIFIREIKKYPREYKSLYGRKIKMFFNGYEVPANLSYDLFKENHSALRLSFFAFSIVCPLALLGIVLAWKRYPSIGLIYLFLCVLSLSNILFHVQGRYRIPAVPFFIIIASYAVYWCFDALRKRQFRMLCGAISGIILLSFYTKPDDTIIRYSSGSRIRSIDYQNLAYAYFDKAMDTQTTKDQRAELLRKAAANLHKSIPTDPNNLEAHILEGAIYYQLGEYGAAKGVFQKALMLSPNNKVVKNYISQITLYHE